MKKIITSLAVILFCCYNIHAQDYDLDKLPSTKEEFVQSEKKFTDAVHWLESTAIGTDIDQRKKTAAWIVAWITNSPTVTVEIKGSLIKPFEKNPDLLIVFMGGYARYCLQNNYSKDQQQCNLAGMKAVVNCYNLGGELKKDKNLSKVVDAEKEGKLEDWVKKTMEEKD